MVSLAIRDLRVSFGFGPLAKNVLALDSLDIKAGEVVALYGPNHSGKSTLLKILAGAPTRARLSRGTSITYNGLPLAKYGQEHCAYMPQRYSESLLPWMSVEDNIRVPFSATSVDEAILEQHIVAFAKDMTMETEQAFYKHYGMTEDASTKQINSLSGGQRQIVALARCLVRPAKLILFDEPFSAIDSFKGAGLRKRVKTLVKTRKATCLIVTHSVQEAVHFADRVVVLAFGAGGKLVLTDHQIRENAEELLSDEAIKAKIKAIESSVSDPQQAS